MACSRLGAAKKHRPKADPKGLAKPASRVMSYA